MKRSLLAAFGAIATVTSVAFAATLNSDGTGFVGKGEVQTAFGWNNATLQLNARGVSFAVVTEEVRIQECVNMTVIPQPGGPPQKIILTDTRTQEREILSAVQHEARKNTQGSVNGFNLQGFGAATRLGGNETGSCPDGYHPQGGWSEWEVESTALYVIHGGQREPLSY